MNKESLLQLATTINCEYESGVWVELNALMEYNEDIIKEYNLTFDDNLNSFHLNVKMKDSNKDGIETFFKSFVEFMEYGDATFYIKEEYDKHIDYYFLSTMDTEKGMLIIVSFS